MESTAKWSDYCLWRSHSATWEKGKLGETAGENSVEPLNLIKHYFFII